MSENQSTPGPESTEQPTGPESASHTESASSNEKSWTEEFTVSGNKLLGKVKELVAEGNVRRIILRNSNGNTLLEIPLNVGLAATAAGAVFAPVLVAVGGIAALVTSVSITVVREPRTEAPQAVQNVEDAHPHDPQI